MPDLLLAKLAAISNSPGSWEVVRPHCTAALPGIYLWSQAQAHLIVLPKQAEAFVYGTPFRKG